MPIEGLLKILESPEASKRKSEIIKILDMMGFNPAIQENLLKKLLGLPAVFPNTAAVKAFTRSYLRIWSKGINKDGRDSSVIIEITKRCNKNCLHCYSRGASEKLDMDDAVLEQIIKTVQDNYKHVFITGGNPVLDKRIFKLAENNSDIVFFMFNNGSGIDFETAEHLARVGNIIPLLGIDGATKKEHERFRGAGSYEEYEETYRILNQLHIPWGYISLVAETNAKSVLSSDFVKDMRAKGAIIGRYIEYLPVGPRVDKELILSGETYYLLESRKKEIIHNREIYIQETSQKKCQGLVFFDVMGNIKNCPFMHYSKFSVNGGSIVNSIRETIDDWSKAPYEGECPIYSNPVGFRDYLVSRGWKNLSPFDEEYLNNSEIFEFMAANYREYLKIQKEKGI